ncbi:MAG TPA: hypothetical protein VE262_24485 [Blastocatellia bacterium]|nr:hypothetical protein [Blastocatellia bacterium]
MPQNLKKKTVELERLVKEREETVKRVLKDYRESVRANAATLKGVPRTSDRERLKKKRMDVERANAEYMRLQKELENLRAQLQTRKENRIA